MIATILFGFLGVLALHCTFDVIRNSGTIFIILPISMVLQACICYYLGNIFICMNQKKQQLNKNQNESVHTS